MIGVGSRQNGLDLLQSCWAQGVVILLPHSDMSPKNQDLGSPGTSEISGVPPQFGSIAPDVA